MSGRDSAGPRRPDRRGAGCCHSNPAACLSGNSSRSGNRDCPCGNGKRDPRFLRPCATLPPGPVQPAPTAGQRPARRAGSARVGRGALAGGFGPPAEQGSAWRCGRGNGPCQDAQSARRRKRFPLSGQQPMRSAPFQHPVRASCASGGSHFNPDATAARAGCRWRRCIAARCVRYASGNCRGSFRNSGQMKHTDQRRVQLPKAAVGATNQQVQKSLA